MKKEKKSFDDDDCLFDVCQLIFVPMRNMSNDDDDDLSFEGEKNANFHVFTILFHFKSFYSIQFKNLFKIKFLNNQKKLLFLKPDAFCVVVVVVV